jgi:ribosomal-protein-alanine N-acetyltransferase
MDRALTSTSSYRAPVTFTGYPEPSLTDGVVRLRRWSLDDLACIEEASRDRRIPEGTTVPTPFTPDDGRRFIERQWSRLDEGEGISLAMAADDTDTAVGLISLRYRQQAGVVGAGYWVVESARGQGIATRGVRLASEWALGSSGVERVEAWVEPDNTASRATLAAAGFEYEGLLRSFLAFPTRRADAMVFSRIRAG